MVLPLIVFAVVAAIVLAGCVAYFYVPSMLEERRLERRLRDVSLSILDAPEDGTIVATQSEGPMPRFDRAAAATSAGSRLARLIEQSGVTTTPSAIVLASIAGCAIGAGCAAIIVRHQPLALIAGAVIGLAAPFAWLLRKRSVRMKKFEEQFPEALDLMSRAILAGHAFQTALGMAADELPAPVGTEFKKTFDRQNFGLPIRDAMNEMADRIPLLDVRFFVTAVAIQRETGGNLAEILGNLAHVVRERFKIRRQIRVHTAHGRFTGYVLLALPAALALALSFIAPEQMRLLFHDPMGQMMIGGAVVMQTIGFFWIRQIIQIEV